MKRFIFILISVLLCLTSCGIEAAIPKNERTFTQYAENQDLYQNAVSYFETLDFDALVSRNDYYSMNGTENIAGLYLQNMDDKSITPCEDAALKTLFEQTDVKLVDWIHRGDLKICAFDMCIPGKNFDYGVYYISEDKPAYFGDPSLELVESGNGFVFEKKASYGTKFTYYTEKIFDHYYYYEIS